MSRTRTIAQGSTFLEPPKKMHSQNESLRLFPGASFRSWHFCTKNTLVLPVTSMRHCQPSPSNSRSCEGQRTPRRHPHWTSAASQCPEIWSRVPRVWEESGRIHKIKDKSRRDYASGHLHSWSLQAKKKSLHSSWTNCFLFTGSLYRAKFKMALGKFLPTLWSDFRLYFSLSF